MQVGVLGVDVVNIGDQYQQVGFVNDGDVGRKFVVIVKNDFVNGYGVIFVDDGDVIEFQQFVQGILDVFLGGVIVKIVVGEQVLGNLQF